VMSHAHDDDVSSVSSDHEEAVADNEIYAKPDIPPEPEEHIDSGKKRHPNPSEQTSITFSTTWSHNRHIVVTDCCLTDNITEALVNPANGWLRHGSGVAKTIAVKGGWQVVNESNIQILLHGKVKCGDAVTTSAGKLPALYIFHAVGPRWVKIGRLKISQNPPQKLHDCVVAALKRAEEHNVTSIAFPNISSGKFGGDVENCADIIVGAVHEYFQQNPNSSVKIVHFNAKNDPRRIQAWESSIKKVGPQGITNLSPINSHTGTALAIIKPFNYTHPQVGGGHTQPSTHSTNSPSSPPTQSIAHTPTHTSTTTTTHPTTTSTHTPTQTSTPSTATQPPAQSSTSSLTFPKQGKSSPANSSAQNPIVLPPPQKDKKKG